MWFIVTTLDQSEGGERAVFISMREGNWVDACLEGERDKSWEKIRWSAAIENSRADVQLYSFISIVSVRGNDVIFNTIIPADSACSFYHATREDRAE